MGKVIKSVFKPVEKIFRTGKSSQMRAQAQAAEEQTRQQQAQYEQQLQQQQNLNNLAAQNASQDVAEVTAGATAQSADAEYNAKRKKQNAGAIKTQLGI